MIGTWCLRKCRIAPAAQNESAGAVVRVRMTAAQQGAFEVYVADPAVTDADDVDDEGWATAREYRVVAALRKGSALVCPATLRETIRTVLTDAVNSADGERTAEGDRAARSLTALHANIEAAFQAGPTEERTMRTVRELAEGNRDFMSGAWAPFPAGKGAVRWFQASNADEAVGQAYRAIHDLKADLDDMEEIPTQLKKIYAAIMAASKAVGDARRDTNQLREMARRAAEGKF
jgi:hypothetical protein